MIRTIPRQYVVTVSVRENDAQGNMLNEYDLLRCRWDNTAAPLLKSNAKDYDLTDPRDHSRRFWSHITLALDHLAQRAINHTVTRYDMPPGVINRR